MLFSTLFQVCLLSLGFDGTDCVYEIRGTHDMLKPVPGTILYIHESLNINLLGRITLLTFALWWELGWKWEVWIVPLVVSK